MNHELLEFCPDPPPQKKKKKPPSNRPLYPQPPLIKRPGPPGPAEIDRRRYPNGGGKPNR